MFASKRQCTVIAEGLKIVGVVTADGTVEVNGKIDGEMHCTSVIISQKAEVAGMIAAENVIVDGKVEGPIQGGDVVLKSQARVVGDIECSSITVEKGAFMEGRLIRAHNGNSREASVAAREFAAAAAARKDDDKRLAAAEASTREAELLVEARHLSGNTEMLPEEARSFLARRKAFDTVEAAE